MDARRESRRVAIACQGGGSHTGFTAGVLKKLLRSEEFKRYEVVGLSGTSGGVVCALLAWHHLLRDDGAASRDRFYANTCGLTSRRIRPPEHKVPRLGGEVDRAWASQLRAILLTRSLTFTSSAPLDTATRRLEGRRS